MDRLLTQCICVIPCLMRAPADMIHWEMTLDLVNLGALGAVR